MISETVNLWGNGAVTLPKAWRERYQTKHFMARENKQGNLEIVPILDVEYYEDEKGNFGLRFPMGIEATELLERMSQYKKKTKNK
jgi:hypothetical protein